METRRIEISELQPNEGQIAGLPKNPRQWKQREFDELKKSIRECPELLNARGCLVYPYNGSYIVIGGNMRLSACKALKMQEVPCIVLPEGLAVDKLKEIAIKDNGAFGEWDFDLLANEWDSLPLGEWGAGLPKFEPWGEDYEESGSPATAGIKDNALEIRIIFANSGDKERFLANREKFAVTYNCTIR